MAYSSGDRVLVHLLLSGPSGEGSRPSIDQDELSRYCAIGRTHMPRVLDPLIEDGLVEEGFGRSPGKPRRVKVYSLTGKGRSEATVLLERAVEEPLTWVDDSGKQKKDTLGNALTAINERLSSGSRSKLPLPLMLAGLDKRLTWDEILWLSGSVGPQSCSKYCLPKGWEPVPPPEPPEVMIDRFEEENALEGLLRAGKVSAVIGEKGSGKRSLLAHYAGTRKMHVLWLRRSKGPDESFLEDRRYDLIVVLGGEHLLLGPLMGMGDRDQVPDPRDSSWPAALREPPMVVCADAMMEAKGPFLRMGGLKEAPFLEACSKAGLPEDIARELFGQCKGSPSMMGYLSSLDPEEMGRMKGAPREEAMFKLLLGWGAFLKGDRSKSRPKNN